MASLPHEKLPYNEVNIITNWNNNQVAIVEQIIKHTGVETHSTVLEVSTTDTDGMNALWAQLCHSRLATQFELALFAVLGTLGTGG